MPARVHDGQAGQHAPPLMEPGAFSTQVGQPPPTRRVEWLDGIRGAAAMFVVLHHTWLSVWPAFPRDIGPWWLGGLLYGHLAVAVFIVVSGFSLSLGPLRGGDTLSGGARRFLGRRAWRIIPPYWAALILSTIISWLILAPTLSDAAVAKGFVVHGLLLQDIVGSFVPNGTFWSIAVEWQIYFVFPLILWLARRTNIAVSVTSTVLLVVAAQLITHLGSPFNKIDHLTPQLLALFALGVLAVHLGHGERTPRLQRARLVIGLGLMAAVVAGALLEGSVWMVSEYFWVDLVFGAGIACLMAVMYSGGAGQLRRVLGSRVGLRLGLFSYSIYLVHGPLLALADVKILRPLHMSPLLTFAILLLVAVPVILVVCYGFHLVFEAPFVARRDFGALRAMPGVDRLLARRATIAPRAVNAAGTEIVVPQESAS